jgi:hypothetical protein
LAALIASNRLASASFFSSELIISTSVFAASTFTFVLALISELILAVKF